MRLGIPLVLGVLFLNPILCFVANRTHNGYEGNFLSHYKVYFTKFTDCTGYDGGFTLGHLWFIAVLIVISFLSCGIIKLVDSICKTSEIRSNLVNIIFTTFAIAGMDYKLWGKPLITYLFAYLLGYRVFSKQAIVARLAKCKWICIAVFIIASISNVTLYIYLEKYAELNTFCNYLAFCFGILSMLCIGHDHLDFANDISRTAAKISYDFYILHFPIVVLCQYILGLNNVNNMANYFVSLLITYPLTVLACLVIKRDKKMIQDGKNK